ncbi:MAG: GNAT family N-acetyltransferase [Burkholderiaceae bacterium]
MTPTKPFVLRAPEAGDFGWVIHAHGRLYAKEYQWDERFEAMVAKITGEFIENFQPQWERCWIAELDGRNVGSVFVVRQSKNVAKLRLLVLEPEARGQGIGRQLVEQVIQFSREKGYRELVLWTNKNLTDAIQLYRSLGFELQSEQAHESFGHALVGQNYRLMLNE